MSQTLPVSVILVAGWGRKRVIRGVFKRHSIERSAGLLVLGDHTLVESKIRKDEPQLLIIDKSADFDVVEFATRMRGLNKRLIIQLLRNRETDEAKRVVRFPPFESHIEIGPPGHTFDDLVSGVMHYLDYVEEEGRKKPKPEPEPATV